MVKKGNMSTFIYGKPVNGSRLIGTKKKTRRVKRGK